MHLKRLRQRPLGDGLQHGQRFRQFDALAVLLVRDLDDPVSLLEATPLQDAEFQK